MQIAPAAKPVQLTAKTTAAVIRKVLKNAFPKTTFSVTTGRGAGVSSVNVSWNDGPTAGVVESFVKPFEAGSFDGMTDCYNYSKGADRYVIVDGVTYDTGCRYVFTRRTISAELANKCIAQIVAYWGGVDNVPVAVPSKFNAADFQIPDAMNYVAVRSDLCPVRDSWYASIHRAANDRTAFARSAR